MAAPSALLPFEAWPDTSTEDLIGAQRRIAAVARAILAGSAPVGPDAFEGVVPDTLGIAAFLTGMGPLLGRWTEDGRISPPEGVARVVSRHLTLNRLRAERMRQEAAPVFTSFNRHGIRPTILKGAHTAEQYFDEPGVRPMSDLDVLVSPDEAGGAQRVLRELGFVDQTHQGSPIPDRVTVWRPPRGPTTIGSVDCEHPDNPWTIDLHTSIDVHVQRGLRTSFGRVPFERSQPARWRGCDVRTFSPVLLVLHLTLHVGVKVTKIRLLGLVEIVRVLRAIRDTAGLDWDELSWLAERTGAARMLVPAVELTERLAPGTFDPTLRSRLARHATGRMRRALDGVASAGFCGWLARDRGLGHKFLYTRGLRDWAVGCAEIVFPAGRRGADYWKTQVRRARWLARIAPSSSRRGS